MKGQYTAKSKKSSALPSGVRKSRTGDGLDEITFGGLPQGWPTLIHGGPGCGKTLLRMEFPIRGATEFNEPGVFLERSLIEDTAAKSLQAIGNLKRICEEHLAGEAPGAGPENYRRLTGYRARLSRPGSPRATSENGLMKDTGAGADLNFEHALAAQPNPEQRYLLRLFVSGATTRSSRAIHNISAICESTLRGCFDLEVIDIYQHPECIQPEPIIVTPTLIGKSPLPVRKIAGDMSNRARVPAGLDTVPRDSSVNPPKEDHVG